MVTIFATLIGVATFINLFNLVCFTAFGNFINKPYTDNMTMVARIESEIYLVILTYLLYAGVVFLIACFFIFAFEISQFDMYVQLYSVLLIFVFCYMLYTTTTSSDEFRRETVFQFYERYCEADGQLSEYSMHLVYEDHKEMLEKIEEFEATRVKTPSRSGSQHSR